MAPVNCCEIAGTMTMPSAGDDDIVRVVNRRDGGVEMLPIGLIWFLESPQLLRSVWTVEECYYCTDTDSAVALVGLCNEERTELEKNAKRV